MEEEKQLKLGENSLIEIPQEAEEFDWQTDPDVIVKHSPGIAIYANRAGEVVIRQYRDSGDDRCVIIRAEDVKKVFKKALEVSNGQA